MNLISQYGPGWFFSKFGGSFFMHEGEPHKVSVEGGRARTNIPCYKATLNSDNQWAWEETTVGAAAFTDVSVFSVPNLGWRCADKGRYLSYYSRNNNSYHRGLAARNLVTSNSSLTRWVSLNCPSQDYRSDAMHAYLALKPEFMPMHEGVAKMAAGEILSFAVSPTIAVVPEDENSFAIMFKQKKAGTVTPEGSMSLIIPELNNYMENM